MINRLSIASHFFFGTGLTAAIFAANPILAQKAELGLDRLILNLIEALYTLKNMG